MPSRFIRSLPFAFAFATVFAGSLLRAEEPRVEVRYPYGPDSLRRAPGIPQGKVTLHEWKDSKVYPGTVRRYSVYVPAQYDATKPAALMVFLDGHAYEDETKEVRVPIVFDNLIAKKEMPVTIAVFVDPGHKKPELPAIRGWAPSPENRQEEYDVMSPTYATFLLTEILPEVKKIATFTDDPEGRAICGMSSGGICAFTVAWERPDQFRKVVSHIGSFVDIRGGDKYPSMIRKGEKKPIRVFLQDGANDNDSRAGNWPLGNKQMYAALKFKQYDVKFVFGEGGHNCDHGGSMFPDTMRWLWRDYGKPAEGAR